MHTIPTKICFLADSHSLYDDRIYWKEAVELKKNGFEVYYVLAGDKLGEGTTNEGIHYILLLRDSVFKNRILNFLAKRIFPGGFYKQLYNKARDVKADVYHIHDLKVNRIGGKLKRLPNLPKVVYDVHEPYPENILDYGPDKGIKSILNKLYTVWIRRWEKRCAARYDLIITTEENMQRRFQDYFPEKPVEVIYNYTDLPLHENNIPEKDKVYDAIYTGGITARRGAWKILEAVKIVVEKNSSFRMLFLGTWFPGILKEEMNKWILGNKLEKNIDLIDAVPYHDVIKYYEKSKTGLGIFLPIRTHKIILQIKIFEYMNYGLPIVGSNFGHIGHIIKKHQCGITVNPEVPDEIAAALQKLLADEALYRSMSEHGRKAVVENYRWEIMGNKLVDIYEKLIR